MKPLKFDLLHKILSQPTAPFRELHVLTTIRAELDSARVPHFTDPAGNLMVGARSKKEYIQKVKTKSSEPLRIFIAHTDHPGFHGVKWLSHTELEVEWHGGSPTQHLENSSVWLASADGVLQQNALFHSVRLIPSGRAIASGVVQTESEMRKKHPDARDLYGGFSFREPVWRDGDFLYTKAADDLVGAFAIVSLAVEMNKKKLPFLGLLTRAEEVGFIGAIAHFDLGWLSNAKRPILCVSLETSRALPGAEIGKGPVVRLGDRYTVFDAAALRIFTELAEKHLSGRHQRRVMDGGSCEATAATVFGFPCVGISVPLGNYHNQSFEGGPDSAGDLGPAPEFVHLSDVQGLLDLCEILLKPNVKWNEPWASRKILFKKELKRYGALLKSGP